MKSESQTGKQEDLWTTKETVSSVNDMLQKVPQVDDRLHYLSLNDFYQEDGSVPFELFSRDGLHLSFSGTELLTGKIEKKIVDILNKNAADVSHISSRTIDMTKKEKKKHQKKKTTAKLSSEHEEINSIVKWIESSDTNESMPNCVLQNISFDAIPISYDTLDFKCFNLRKSKVNPISEKASEYVSERQSGGGDMRHDLGSSQENSQNYAPTSLVGNVDELKFHENISENVFMCKSSELNALEALEILTNVDVSKITEQIDYRPKGGNVYLYALKQGKKTDEEWKCDGYTFWQNGSKKVKIKSKGLNLRKIYFKLINENEEDNRFKKYAWRLEGQHENTNVILIQYTGDESIYKGQPHGNSKKNKTTFVRTKTSVFRKIQELEPRNPVAVMNKINAEINADCQNTGYSNVRNKNQVKNIQKKMRLENGLGPDSLYNLHLLFYHLEGYISDIKTAPDLYILLGLKNIYEEFDKLLRFKTDETVPLFYDTTFNLGDFYVSTLSFQHYLFENAPVIPLGIMIHERKFQKHHEVFLEAVKEKVPLLGTKNLAIVTDRETGIINAIKKVFPNLTLLICWNHILRDTKDFLRKIGEISKNIEAINQQLKKLLECDSLENYIKLLYGDENNQKQSPGVRSFWSILFVEYFDKHLDKTIRENAGKWVVDSSEVYNPFSGITNNASESNHARYKHLTEFKENQVDLMVLFLQYLQKNDFNSIMKGFCDLGDLSLRKKYRYLKKDPTLVKLAPVLHPSKLIEIIKGKLLAQNQLNENLIDSEKENEKCSGIENPRTVNSQKPSHSYKLSSQGGHANKVIFDKGISLVPEMGGFVVKGDSGNLNAVQLFPKEKCQCPATVRCYHIKAARQSINLPPDNEKNQNYNLNELRRKSRKKADKKSGRKRPRIGDLDTSKINPAPVSILKTYNESSDDDLNLTSHNNFTESTPKQVNASHRTSKSILKTPQVNSESKKSLRFEKTCKSKTKFNIEISPKNSTAKNSHSNEASEDLISSSQKIFVSENVSNRFEFPTKTSRFQNEEAINFSLEMELSHSFENEVPVNEFPWIDSLLLNHTDKTLILNYKKLHSGHMEAASIIIKKEFPQIQGFQLTERVPKYIPDEGRWHVGTVMEPVSGPACQILHTHTDHWVVSFIDKEGKIYLFDSLGIDRPERAILTPGLQIQLAILYGKNKKCISVIVPETQRQNNSTDCGMFSIAHMFEFCIKGKVCPNVIFDTTKMRKHLVSCFETESVIEFPKTNKSLNSRKKKEPKIFDIDLFCMCNLPECLDDVVQCESCLDWYHKHCVVAPADISLVNILFMCPSCR